MMNLLLIHLLMAELFFRQRKILRIEKKQCRYLIIFTEFRGNESSKLG